MKFMPPDSKRSKGMRPAAAFKLGRWLLVASVLTLVRVVAFALARSRMGKLLQTISVPRLREHAGRTASTVVGVSLGVAVLIAVSVVNRSIMDSFSDTVEEVAGKADLQVRAGSTGFDEELFETVRQLPGVHRATRVLEQTVRVQGDHDLNERILVLGIDLLNDEDRYFRSYPSDELEEIRQDPLTFLNSPYHIVVSRSLAQRLGRKLHDTIALRTPLGIRDFEIWGFLDAEGVGRAFGGDVALMDLVAMQVAFDRGHNIDQIDVAVRPGTDVRAVAKQIAARLGSGFAVAPPARRTEKVGKMLGSLASGLTMASLVAVLVGMFLIYSTMSISVVQRRHEIGVVRALGMMRRQVLGLFVLEGAVLGAVGSTLGIAFGLALSNVLVLGVEQTVSELFVQVATGGLSIDPGLILGCWILGVAATVIASVLPAYRGARVEPTQALARKKAGDVPLRGARRLWVDGSALGLVLVALVLLRVSSRTQAQLAAPLACVAVVLAGALAMPRFVQLVHRVARVAMRRVGAVELILANENLPREIGRVSSTASALMVGVAMSLAFTSFVDSFTTSTISWVDQMLPADLWVSSAARMAGGRSVPMTDTLQDELAGLDGVEFVERVRMVDIEFRDTPVKLISMDAEVIGPYSRLTMIEGEQGEAREGLRAGEIVLSENFARRFGAGRGDVLELPTSRGTQRFRVAAVIVDYTSDQGSVLVDRTTYQEAWQDTRVDTYKLYLHPGTPSEPVRRAIYRRWGDRFDLFVLTQREFRAEILALLEQTFGVMHVLELVAVVIAVLGVINAVLANVLDRVREYGVLRAVGMLRAQVKKMVVGEAALIGLVGASVGTLVGLGIGYVLLEHINVQQTGWHLPYRPSVWAALMVSAPVILAASLSGWYPAKLASERPVATTLSYE